MMNRMLRPEQANFMGNSMFPVVNKIRHDERKHGCPPRDRKRPGDERVRHHIIEPIGAGHDQNLNRKIGNLG